MIKWIRFKENPFMDGSGYVDVVYDKDYEVVSTDGYSPPIMIRIINDSGKDRGVFFADCEDVTTEVFQRLRDDKLNSLGI
jgi:hypothetical protein